MKDLRKWSDIKQALLDYHNSLTMNNDLIRRSDAVKAISNDGDEHWWYEERINEVPAVDAVEVVHGRWEYTGSVMQTCQRCETSYNLLGGNHCKPWNCCPNCGARMDGE